MSFMYPANTTTMEPAYLFYKSKNACPSDSTEAAINHTVDDGEEEVTSKMTPIPKKSLWGVVKEFFQMRKRYGPYPFAKYPPPYMLGM